VNAIPVLAAIALCLALAWVVSWDLAPLILKPRADGNAAAVRPALEHRGVPITDPAAVRAKVAALLDCTGGANPYPAQTRPQPRLTEPLPLARPYAPQVTRWLP
jgi:hypothetical protein